MASSEAERLLRIARRDLRMARRLLEPDVEEASWVRALIRPGSRRRICRRTSPPRWRRSWPTESAALTDPAHAGALADAYREAQVNPLWAPLQQVLQNARDAGDQPLNPALRDSILLITILVAFLEAAVQQLRPLQPAVVMRFGGIGG